MSIGRAEGAFGKIESKTGGVEIAREDQRSPLIRGVDQAIRAPRPHDAVKALACGRLPVDPMVG